MNLNGGKLKLTFIIDKNTVVITGGLKFGRKNPKYKKFYLFHGNSA